jgi:hypothetical protein
MEMLRGGGSSGGNEYGGYGGGRPYGGAGGGWVSAIVDVGV